MMLRFMIFTFHKNPGLEPVVIPVYIGAVNGEYPLCRTYEAYPLEAQARIDATNQAGPLVAQWEFVCQDANFDIPLG